MTFGKTTHADLYRWQERTHRALGVMLVHGRTAKLPPLMWTMASNGALTGEAGSLTATRQQQVDAMCAWAYYLNATVEERTDKGGVIHLYASWTWRQDDRVKGCLRATIFPDHNTTQEPTR